MYRRPGLWVGLVALALALTSCSRPQPRVETLNDGTLVLFQPPNPEQTYGAALVGGPLIINPACQCVAINGYAVAWPDTVDVQRTPDGLRFTFPERTVDVPLGAMVQLGGAESGFGAFYTDLLPDSFAGDVWIGAPEITLLDMED